MSADDDTKTHRYPRGLSAAEVDLRIARAQAACPVRVALKEISTQIRELDKKLAVNGAYGQTDGRRIDDLQEEVRYQRRNGRALMAGIIMCGLGFLFNLVVSIWR